MTDDTSDEPQPKPERWPLSFKEVEVPPDNPWQFDRLDRERYGSLLTNLIERTETPFVLALDSAWGTGKTSFVKMWRQDLENQGFETLYFNAWETDYVAEPLIALVGELGVLGGEEARDEFQKVKSIASKVLKKSIPILVRIGTQGLLNLDDTDVEGAIGELAQGVAQEGIDEYESRKKDLVAFREALGKLVEEIADERPLVFFIDELDRCRPNFAVELLERVKHLFEVPGIFFVLSTDQEQLAHSVQAVYGENFHGAEYLRRFIDLTYVLPEPPEEVFPRYLFELTGIKARLREPGEILAYMMKHLKFSLRKQERAVTLLALAARCVGNQDVGHPILPALVALRVWRPFLFQEFSIGSKEAAEVLIALEEVDREGWRSPKNDESAWVEASFLTYDLVRFDRRQPGDGRGKASRERLAAHEKEVGAAEQSGPGALADSWSSAVIRVRKHFIARSLGFHNSWRIYFDAVALLRGFVGDG